MEKKIKRTLVWQGGGDGETPLTVATAPQTRRRIAETVNKKIMVIKRWRHYGKFEKKGKLIMSFVYKNIFLNLI